MVLPGWNVTEPLQVAVKFYLFVRAYRDADKQIKDFAIDVKKFCATVKALDECLMSPGSTPLDDDDALKVAADGCKRCAENCQKFINNFFKQFDAKQLAAPAQDEVGRGHRLNWMWKKDEAAKLALTMNEQVNYLNLHLSIAERKDRQRQNSTTMAPAPRELGESMRLTGPDDFSSQLRAVQIDEPKALTPRELFSRPGAENISASDDLEIPPDLESLPSSQAETIPREIHPRRDSGVSVCAFSNAIMDNLTGVTIYRRTDNVKPLPVKKLEFVKDLSGSLCCIIATLPAGYPVKFLHQIPPSSQVIPHIEHPMAYNNRKVLRIKFLEPHQLTSERWSPSVNTPSPSTPSSSSVRSFSIASTTGTPETLPSTASISDAISIGSPLLSSNTSMLKKETNFPKYEFEDERDHRCFQEHVLGKELLVNVPVYKIASKHFNSSKIHLQSETQCLRLWRSASSQTSQTVMYYANGLDNPRYLEHNIQCFRINESKSSPTVLFLEIQQAAESPSISTKRQGSIKSFLSPTLSPKSSRKSSEVDATSPKSEMLMHFDNLSCLIITFTEARGKTAFLNQAVFDATQDFSASLSFPFRQP